MIHLFTSIAFGDTLITLSLLERLPAGAPPHQALCTRPTAIVPLQLMRAPPPVVEVLDREAALYNVRVRGPRAALRDFVALRRRVGQVLRPGDTIAFEHLDPRSRALVPRGCRALYAPATASVYEDRRTLLSQIFGALPPWPACARPQGAVRKVLINPTSRQVYKYLPEESLDALLALAQRRAWEVALVDPGGRYARFAGRAASYHDKTTLADAARLLRESDLNIGPDSLFQHLAYYYGVPTFGFFQAHLHTFLLPGMREAGNYIFYDDGRDAARLERSLLEFVDGTRTDARAASRVIA